jgi:Protein of unknown function (DUF3053)
MRPQPLGADAMVTRRLFVLSAAATTLTGWSWGSESNDAKALADFLKARIIDQPGVKFARPSAAEARSFGRFAADYAVIPQFHDELAAQFTEPFQKAVASARNFLAMDKLVKHRLDLATVRVSLDPITLALDAAVTKATTARAALNHPEPLKATFAAAYDKSVVQPITALREVLPVARSTFDAGLRLAGHMVSNEKFIKIKGVQIEVSNPDVLRQLNGLIAALQQQSTRLTEAERKLQAVNAGS